MGRLKPFLRCDKIYRFEVKFKAVGYPLFVVALFAV